MSSQWVARNLPVELQCIPSAISINQVTSIITSSSIDGCPRNDQDASTLHCRPIHLLESVYTRVTALAALGTALFQSNDRPQFKTRSSIPMPNLTSLFALRPARSLTGMLWMTKWLVSDCDAFVELVDTDILSMSACASAHFPVSSMEFSCMTHTLSRHASVIDNEEM